MTLPIHWLTLCLAVVLSVIVDITKQEDISSNLICSGEFCDPGYEPYPNIVSAMTGYNIFKGNAFHQGVQTDPGFHTNYIFTPVVQDGDGRYALASGITIRSISKCDFSMSTVISSSLTELKRNSRNSKTISNGWKTNPPIDISYAKKHKKKTVEEKQKKKKKKGLLAKFWSALSSSSWSIPPLWDQYGIQNEDYQQHSEYFKKVGGTLTMNSATCALYTMQINRLQPPPFHPEVVDHILQISKQISDRGDDEQTKRKKRKKRKKLFHLFVQTFGTHFLQSATMGARLTISKRYTKETIRKHGMENITKCNRERTTSWWFKHNDTKVCSEVGVTTNSMIDDLYTSEYIVSYGSRPEDSLTEWGNQEFSSPVPIKMELVPITTLFHSEFLDNDATLKGKIKRNKRGTLHKSVQIDYNEYCSDNKKALGIENCDVNEIVCGWNDDCDPVYDKCEQLSIDEVKCTAHDYDEIVERFHTFVNTFSVDIVAKNNEQKKHIQKNMNSPVDFTPRRAYYITMIDTTANIGDVLAVGKNVLTHNTSNIKAALGWTSKQRSAKPSSYKEDIDNILNRANTPEDACRDVNPEHQETRLEEMQSDEGYDIDFYIEAFIQRVSPEAEHDPKNDIYRYFSEGTKPDYYPDVIERCKVDDNTEIALEVGIGLGITNPMH